MNNIVLSKNNYKKELSNILHIAEYNEFPISKIYQLNNKIKAKIKYKKHTTLNNINNKGTSWASIEYYKGVSEKIGKTFHKLNINLGYKSNNNHKNILQNKVHKTEKLDCSGIYEINCECGSKYVGKTARKFKTRFKEHTNSFIYNKPEKSTFANHLLNSHHSYNPNSFKIIKIIQNRKLLDTWENIEIFKAYKTGKILNEQIPNIHNPLYNTFLKIK